MGTASSLAAWERFQSGSPVRARPDILESWRRSRRHGVDPDRLALTHTDIDEESPFLRIGRRVVEKMADLLVGNSTSLALADSAGTVSWRWDSERSVAKSLDHVDFGPGSRVGEPMAGTNGIGMATTTKRAALVVGAEHYKQPWHSWACAAAPVIDPITRRAVGTVNVACRAEDANHLLLVAVRALVSGVETALGEAATARQRRMLDAHMSLSSTTSGAVVTVDSHTMIVADSAAGLNLNRAELWELVKESGVGTTEVALTDELHARVYPVSPGRIDDGVVLVVRRGVPRSLPVSAMAPLPNLTPLEEAERKVIADALAECGGNKTEVATRLGLSRGTLYDRLRRYRLT
ncbi:hypothetical protein NIIDNTM18_43840 [Mycolicibacterium litorale]|uniref:DNA binding HTH domain-containing protein n=1 Tax=Mycolicibacterium litorale TaxID=758802 RepID=A0A6S6PAV3_9MYCO|nr:helix-turn-helix domain-containing protein [Mycolicibacterium litorale]BCI55106.1 hypothetical protein NIIDNTM18_43840 [Mycolicibacterium litorale]